MFLCSILSCDRKRQSSEQDMKDSLAAANFMKCAKFLYNTLFDDELKCFKPRIFIKYKQPVNGYDVTVMCLPYNYTYDKERETEIWGNALLYFEKEDNRFYIYNESFSDSVLYYVNEQEVRDNMILEDVYKRQVSIPLLPIALEILEKYHFQVPKVRENTMLKCIKEAGKKAGIRCV